jgi:hypothetical protein
MLLQAWVWNQETREYDPLTLPHCKVLASMSSPSTVARSDKEVANDVGLAMSDDGMTAHVDVRAALIQ